MMQKAISTTIQSFAVGCMIFMLSLCVSYWERGEEIFNQIQTRFDFIVLEIFIVALIGGGFGHFIYQLNIKHKVQVFLHYATTISAILVVSIWLEFVSIWLEFVSIWLEFVSMSYINLFMYFISTSVIFFIIWYVSYVKLKKEADLINSAIMNAKKSR
ncbi:DUF3021 family protein [Solibacillus sp. R5-41]|uniref:DUF3021 family protein n=1 Tax=Solibacillus sp. R5-41 TaxID=2048654 RepID=UPI0012FE5987|nr:DUF3021 family protein [Solibacillus sp. R5-41]